MISEEILRQRKTGLGSSDIAAILGISKYKSPLDVYLDKMGDSAENISNELIYWGNRMEPIIAEEYSRRKGVELIEPTEIVRHHKKDFLIANVDRLTVDGSGIIECKTASAFIASTWGEEGTDQVPDAYLLQVAHQSKVYESRGIRFVDIAVLIGGNDFRIHRYTPNKELEDRIESAATSFWNDHVLKKIPPAPRTEKDLKTLYPQDNMNDAVADNDAINVLNNLKNIRHEIELLSKKEEEYKNHVKILMANASRLVDDTGRKLATWTTQNTQRFDSTTFKKSYPEMYNDFCKTTESRVLRIS
jgi:putative phage-type endonuclease